MGQITIFHGQITISNGKTHYKWPCSIANFPSMLIHAAKMRGPQSALLDDGRALAKLVELTAVGQLKHETAMFPKFYAQIVHSFQQKSHMKMIFISM